MSLEILLTRCFLKILAPKSRFRGGASVQHVRVTGAGVVHLVSMILGHLPAESKLYPHSDGTFRKRWDAMLQRLEVPVAMQFTPASLRAGGTVAAYNDGVPIHDLLWRLRLQHQKTLAHYLQEVAVATSLLAVPERSREIIKSTAALYWPLLVAARRAAAGCDLQV